jgi:hypothetical protein
MKIKGIAWLGTRTNQYEQMVEFSRDVLGLSQTTNEPGFAIFDLPNGDRFELFGPPQNFNMFMTHPVAGFLVDDIEAARADRVAVCCRGSGAGGSSVSRDFTFSRQKLTFHLD